ncbi:hypothetical protein [Micromonospora sp. NPDC005174]
MGNPLSLRAGTGLFWRCSCFVRVGWCRWIDVPDRHEVERLLAELG